MDAFNLEDFEMTEEQARELLGRAKAKLESNRNIALEYKWPPALVKAIGDPFDYALRLTTGEVWRFREATYLSPDWVRIEEFDDSNTADDQALPVMPFHRGVDVRVSEIVWVADAPHGS